MSSDPRNIRNIPDEVVQIARQISRHTGLSESDVLRLALCSGILVEATKVTPDRAGTFAGMQGAYLAKALRRHLGSAIDLLLEQGQHPSIGMLSSAQLPSPLLPSESEAAYDISMANELEGMGMGIGLSLGMEEPVGV
ncbi:MAG: hypothetical protein H0U76_25820 [Ktedonobacteraceae bacterium]|nr:hypothetical protein [Ktedonobacteraceae bacterium]